MTTQKPKNPSILLAENIHEILTNTIMRKEDYYDFMKFIKEKIEPDMKRLSELLGSPISLAELEEKLDMKVYAFSIHNKETHEENYRKDYLEFKSNIFTRNIRLFLRCKGCKKDFDSSLLLTNESFNEISLKEKHHVCPHCSFENVVNKCDYEVREDV